MEHPHYTRCSNWIYLFTQCRRLVVGISCAHYDVATGSTCLLSGRANASERHDSATPRIYNNCLHFYL